MMCLIHTLARRTWATAQQSPQLLAHLEWWRAYYHGCRVLTIRCEWPLQNLANEGGSVWRNASGSGRRRWQLGKRTGGGQQGKCSRASCLRFALERHASLIGEVFHVARKSVKMPGEALGWSLVSRRGSLSGLSTEEIQPETPSQGACRIIHHVPWEHLALGIPWLESGQFGE